MLVFCLVLVFHSGFELWWFEFVVGVMVLRVVLLQFRVGIWWLFIAGWFLIVLLGVVMVLGLGVCVWFDVWHLVLAGCWV